MNSPDSIAERPTASVGNPKARPDDANSHGRGWHRHVLATSVVVILLALILQVRSDQRVFVSGAPAVPIPETCGMQIMFGRPCPGCGLTRSFIHLAHGDWRSSLAIHRIGWLLALLVLCQIPYRLLALWNPELTVGPRWSWGLGILIIVLLSVNWIYNLVQEFSSR